MAPVCFLDGTLMAPFLEEWEPFEAKVWEGRPVTVIPGVKEHQPKFWEVGEGYAREVIERVKFNLGVGVEGTQLPFGHAEENRTHPTETRIKGHHRRGIVQTDCEVLAITHTQFATNR
jgi:hypothetical protein